MGQDQSLVEKQHQHQQFMLQYTSEREYIHPQFGQVKLYQHIQTNNLICVKRFNTRSEKEQQDLIQHISNRNLFSQNNLLKILALHQQDQMKICSSGSSILLILQYYQETLADEINLRKNNNKPYTEGHIWILLQQIIDPCHYLREKNTFHGDIKPSTIYLDENGSVKLIECSLIPQNDTGYDKMLQCKDKSYLSPLLLKQYQEMNFCPIHDQEKSDIYSLGLTVLSAILTEELYDCFDYTQGVVLIEELESKFTRIKTMGYSQVLIQFIKQLLILDENERPTWQMLKEFIDKYRDKIYNMIPFYLQQFATSRSPVKTSNQFSTKSPLRQNVMYIPIQKTSVYQSQQFNTSRSDNKPKHIHITKENY